MCTLSTSPHGECPTSPRKRAFDFPYRMSQHSLHTKAATYKGNPSRSAIRKTIDSKFRSCGRSIGNVARKIRNATRTSLKRLWRGDADEQKKVVLEKGLKRALARCSVHLLAVSATTTLAYFNLAGYFIGSQYQGLTGGVYQALDTLCLQVTAKLLVKTHPLDFPRAYIFTFSRSCLSSPPWE